MSTKERDVEGLGGDEGPDRSTGRRRLIGDRGSHFLKRMEGETGANIAACYQCERCTNACPVSIYMDIKTHQVQKRPLQKFGRTISKGARFQAKKLTLSYRSAARVNKMRHRGKNIMLLCFLPKAY